MRCAVRCACDLVIYLLILLINSQHIYGEKNVRRISVPRIAPQSCSPDALAARSRSALDALAERLRRPCEASAAPSTARLDTLIRGDASKAVHAPQQHHTTAPRRLMCHRDAHPRPLRPAPRPLAAWNASSRHDQTGFHCTDKEAHQCGSETAGSETAVASRAQ